MDFRLQARQELLNFFASTLDATHIQIDTYSNKKYGDYVKCLDLGKIKREIFTGRTILEGIRLLEIAVLLNIIMNKLVYVKRFSRRNVWIDELLLHDASFPTLTSFHAGVIKYHKKFLPHKKADYILCKKEDQRLSLNI